MKSWSKKQRKRLSVVCQRVLCQLYLPICIICTNPITATPIQGTLSTCDAPSVHNGSVTTLTCIFNEDLTQRKLNVYINHYVTDSIEHNIALVCKSSNGSFDCTGIHGYRFMKYEGDSTASKYKLITEISNVNHHHAGKYFCDVSWPGGDKENHYQVCTLHVFEFPHNLSTENSTINEVAENETKLEAVLIVVAIIVTLMVIIFTVILIYVLYNRQRKRKATNRDKTNSEQDGHLLDVQIETNQTFDVQ